MRIIMDDREPELIERLLRREGILVERRRIEVADYLVGMKACIERKSLNDFVKSIYDGRLFDQVDQMKDSCEVVIILVEEPLFSINQRARPHYLGALSSLALRGVSIIHVSSMEDTARFLVYLARKIEGNRPSIIPVRKRRRLRSWEEAYSVLVSFPSIGPKSAERLLNEFGTLREVFNADFFRLKRVVGEARARKILEVLNTPFKPIRENRLIEED